MKNRRDHWLPDFQAQLNLGLSHSGWVQQVRLNQIEGGREICKELWPFIRELPTNIVSVTDKLPAKLSAARNFLNQLADQELHYQNLYLSQCELVGLEPAVLRQSLEIPHSAERLIASMRRYCEEGTVLEGVQAIVVAELAATQFARVVLTEFEGYFGARMETYGAQNIEVGLTWLRLHAKTNIRHAIWMKRMLDALELDSHSYQNGHDSKNMPPAVEEILLSICELWQTTQPGAQSINLQSGSGNPFIGGK